MSDDQELGPTEMRPGRNGGTLRTGNPGNRGNPNGRTGSIPTKERAGRVVRAILVDLEERMQAAKEGRGPKLSTRDLVAFGRLAAEVEARDLPGDKPPTRIMVLAGSEADLRRAMDEPTPAPPELDVGDDAPTLPPGDATASP
jgi:hypothetical protein